MSEEEQAAVPEDPVVLPVRRYNEKRWTACVRPEDWLSSASLTYGEATKKSALGELPLLSQYELSKFM